MKGKKRQGSTLPIVIVTIVLGGYARYYGIYRGHGAGADSTYV